ncbi:MAG: hypothetical protein AB1346_06570, partial [Thermodesulfobacteriota bacterium]
MSGGSGDTVLLDRLREIGVRDTARVLSWLLEFLRRHPTEPDGLELLFLTAAGSPDPDLFFLNLSRWSDSLRPDPLRDCFRNERLLPMIGGLLGGSEFLPEQVARRPEIFETLFEKEGVLSRPAAGELRREALEEADRCATEEEMKRALRRMKHREMTRIAARDLAGISPLPEVTQELSALAEAALEGAVRFARRAVSTKAGEPTAVFPDGKRLPCRFVVLGMGKLGGR